MKNIFTLLILCTLSVNTIYAEEGTNEKSNILRKRVGLVVNYWHEPALKPGLLLGADFEFMNSKGHGVGVTFPQMLVFYFPYNYVSLSVFPTVSYRFLHPENGFYTSLSIGVGVNTQWKTTPLFNLEGDRIDDDGFTRMIATAQVDLGYDFEIKYQTPVRLYASVGWNGIYPNNLGINNHMMFQLGVNVKLADLN